MTPPPVDAQPVLLMSVMKPIAMALGLLVWARVVTLLDDDLVYIGGARRTWNSSQITVGILGFGLWLFIPEFWIGTLASALATASTIGCYIRYRNGKVPPAAKWTFKTLVSSHGWGPAQKAWAKHGMSVRLLNSKGETMSKPARGHHYSAPHIAFEQMLGYALAYRAERVLIRASTQASMVILQIDGVGYPQPKLEPTDVANLIHYVKHGAGLDVSERRRMMWGNLRLVAGDGTSHNLGVQTSGSLRGLEMLIDIDRESRRRLGVAQLGFLADQQSRLEKALVQPNRVILTATPPGHGLTTLLHALLDRHAPVSRGRLVTLDDEHGLSLKRALQFPISPTAEPRQLARQVTGILGQKPSVLAIGCPVSSPVVNLLASAASDVRIYAAMRQSDTFEMLQAWVAAVSEPTVAANGLGAIVAGRLLRRLCPVCRQPYTPDADMLKKLNLQAQRVGQLYKQGGQLQRHGKTERCPNCSGLGYRGRVGVFEVMTLDDHGRALVAQRQLEQLRIYLHEQKMTLLQEAALTKVIDGVTTIGELTRVLGGVDRHESPAPARTPVNQR